MADDEKQKALISNGGELGDVDATESAAMARTRSRALDLAVFHGVRQAQLHQQQVAQPQQPSIVRWERFLPQQQLRVLLVEDDDSTGHVVTALLRNCGYEVTFVPSGLWAWELLMDQSRKVDLVLTEVVMPGLSGIGLLSRIMNQEPLKHIPVIMMSSLDSMGVVFKCLSNGAVDFLVKPVRKNELKNLWQHIWRRCQSSSGSGRVSGSQTQKVTQPSIAGEANNNSGSDDESDRMSSELNLEGGSDNGSGTQSSWTKKAMEVKSSRQGISGGSRMHSSIQSKNGRLLGPDYQKGKDNGLSTDTNLADSGVAAAELPFFCNIQVNLNSAPEMVRLSAANAKDNEQADKGIDSAYPCADWQMGNGVNETLMKEQESAAEHQADSEDADDLLEKHASNSPSFKDNIFSDSSSPSLLKLSLKRPSQAENDTEGEVRGALKRSRSSAFSRYNNSGSNTPLPAGTISAKINAPANVYGDHSLAHCSSVGSSYPLSMPLSSRTDTPFSDIGTDEAMASPFLNGIPHDSGNQNGSLVRTTLSGKQNLGPCSNKEGKHMNTGSGTQTHFYPLPGMQHAFGSCKEPFSADINLPPHWGRSSENVEVQEFHIPRRSNEAHQSTHVNQDSEAHHHSHRHHHHVQHHYHHHDDQPQQSPQSPQLEDSTVIHVGASAPKCGSSNMEKCPEDINGQSGSCNGYGSNGNGAVSLNGSATGSNGGQSAAAEPAGGVGNVDSSTQIGAGSGLTVAHDHLLPLDEGRHARREAALTKFRQKRKERCFEKKVRYQSRKRLAEQRPRVRGQFVKQCVK